MFYSVFPFLGLKVLCAWFLGRKQAIRCQFPESVDDPIDRVAEKAESKFEKQEKRTAKVDSVIVNIVR